MGKSGGGVTQEQSPDPGIDGKLTHCRGGGLVTGHESVDLKQIDQWKYDFGAYQSVLKTIYMYH